MFAYGLIWFDLKIGISVATKSDAILLRRRFRALQRQLPWLYAIFLANLFGLQIAFAGERSVPLLPTLVMSAIIAARALRWLGNSREHFQLREIQREMRKTFVIAALFCFGFACWTCWLSLTIDTHHLIELALFAGLAAVGCTYAMSGFPALARIPLLILILPLVGMLIITGGASHIGIAICILIVSGVSSRLLTVHDDAFVQLVRSFVQIAAERRRAIEAEKRAVDEQSRVRLIANSDALTGLANRRGFLASIDSMSKADKRCLALILIDLDGFKPVNDTFGHASGDALLVNVSRRLKAVSCYKGMVSRLGGDEFALVCQCQDAAKAFEVASTAVAALNVPFSVDGRSLSISASAGVAFTFDDDVVEAMRRADLALYRSKQSGRGLVHLFTDDMDRDVQRKRSIEQALREPGIDSEIEVAFQPIFRLENMRLCSFEALARWKHSTLGWISPAEFIPITEQISVLESMTAALLRRATSAAHCWPVDVRLSFNVSAVQLCTAGSADKMLEILDSQDFDPQRLQIEVTETALLADFGVARENITKLRDRCVSIVLDDFGAGYSSINYLRQIEFEAVKLDGSLITAATEQAGGLPLLRGVLALCESIGLPCVAEHIESQQQLDQLRHLGCEFGQGFLLSRPLTADAAAALAGLVVAPTLSQAAA